MARGKGGAAQRARWRVAWRVAGGLVLVALLAGVLAAPTLADGYAALQWTRHYAAGFGGERPQERVRQCGRWAARAVDALAPLPAASEAATLALQTGRQFEGERPAAVLALFAEVRAALERQQASTWRGRGLTPLVDEARALEQGARAAATALDNGVARPSAPSAAVPGSSPAPVAAPSHPAPLSPSSSPLVSPSPGRVTRLSPSPSPVPSPTPTPAASRAPAAPKPSRRTKPRPRPTGGPR